jgi:dipeptidyl aminopeptidase/acylaminoacyl peptidase
MLHVPPRAQPPWASTSPHHHAVPLLLCRYDRADGVTMTATLYLPPGYDKERDGPLPCILWAYPREFKSREAAGQMRRSPHQFAGGGLAGVWA